MSDKKIKILIMEDEIALADLLVAKLKKEGFEVDFAYNGEDGYNKIEKFDPDLILLDIVMPKMNGYDVLEKLKAEKLNVPVIIISNSGQPVEIEKTKKLGAIDHLIKTEFSPNDVLQKVNKFLKKKNNGNGHDEEKIEFKAYKNEAGKDIGIRVLLVEDDNFLREICSKKLINEGFTVYEAIDGSQALEGAIKLKPDIMLLDIILPAIDGFQVLYQIKTHKDKSIANIPVIMLSNLGQEDDIQKAMDTGANDYLVKAHFTTEEIVQKIKSILKK